MVFNTKLPAYIGLLILLFNGHAAAQQQFQMRLYPEPLQKAMFMEKAKGNGYILASNCSDSVSEKGILITRLDDQFSVLWHKKIDEPGLSERVNSFYEDSLGNIFIAGYIEEPGIYGIGDMLVIRTDSLVNVVWKQIFIYDTLESGAIRILDAGNGSIYVIGNTEEYYFSTSYLELRPFLMKLSASGSMLWNYDYYPTSQLGHSAEGAILSEDGMPVTISSYPTLTDVVIGFMKFDTTGVRVWDSRWLLSGNNPGPMASIEAITSWGSGYALFGVRGIDTTNLLRNYIMKCDSVGNQLLQYRYGIGTSSGRMQGVKAIQTSDGGFALAGISSQYPILLKVDSNLIPQWCRQYTVIGGTVASLLRTPDNGYIILTGYGNKILLIKTDSLGNSACNHNSIPFYYIPEVVIAPFAASGFEIPAFLPFPYQPVVSTVNNIADTLCYGLTSVSENDRQVSFSVFPNPFTDEFSVSGFQFTGKAAIKIWDIYGRVVYTQTLETPNFPRNAGQVKLKTDTWQSGIYLLEINSGKEKTIRKIVKQ